MSFEKVLQGKKFRKKKLKNSEICFLSRKTILLKRIMIIEKNFKEFLTIFYWKKYWEKNIFIEKKIIIKKIFLKKINILLETTFL